MAWLSDPEYLFRQDIKEKKSTGRGAFHKKSGAKSKKCTLPHEYLTKKEREKLNGECKTYKIGSFEVTWDEFKTWPEEFQVKHINSFLNRYDCGLSAISEYVFHNNEKSLWGYIKHKGYFEYINNPPRGRRHEVGDMKLRDAAKEFAKDEQPEEIQNDSSENTPEEEMPKTDTAQHAKAPDSINISTDRENAQYILDLIMDIYGNDDFKIEFWVHKTETEQE